MRSKTYMSKINLTARKQLTVANRNSREKKTDMLRSIGKQSGESVETVQSFHRKRDSRRKVQPNMHREAEKKTIFLLCASLLILDRNWWIFVSYVLIYSAQFITGRLKMHDLKMQDWKMTDNILANSEQNYGVWKMQDWKMTDKILANSGKNYGVWKMQDWKMTDHVN